MIKRYSCFLILMLISFFYLYPGPTRVVGAEESTAKIGYVDSQRVVDESKAGAAALQELEQFKKKNEEELTGKMKEIAQQEEELNKKKTALSPEALSQMEESIRKKNIDLKRFKEDKEIELKEMYFKHLNKIKEEILKVVQEIGDQKGYMIILNKDESVIYANPAYDITKMVIEAYDKKIAEPSTKK